MQLTIEPTGDVRTIYSEELNLTAIGNVDIRRGSHVEPDEHGMWHANLYPVGGPTLGPFSNRSQALTAEVSWLEEHWL